MQEPTYYSISSIDEISPFGSVVKGPRMCGVPMALSNHIGFSSLRVGLLISAYANIRASIRLPDKEFRYLRTVIVTAAVYRGFGSLLFPIAQDDKSP